MYQIRRPTLHDLNGCVELDASYQTQHVWQMYQRVEAKDIRVSFHLVHLPRPLTVTVPQLTENLVPYWQRGDCLYVARVQSQVVGFLHMVSGGSSSAARIKRHVVTETYRRQGVGSALFSQALQWAREHQLRSLEIALTTKNHPATAFYLSQGFTFCGFSEELHGKQQIHLQFSRPVR